MKKQILLVLALCGALSLHGTVKLENKSNHKLAFEVLCNKQQDSQGIIMPLRYSKYIYGSCAKQKIFVSMRTENDGVVARFSILPAEESVYIDSKLVFYDDRIEMHKRYGESDWKYSKTYFWGHTE
jgi:hypothetical protein